MVSARVTPEFFRTLGVPLAVGRDFTDEELDFATDKVAIITEQFWRSEFNADPNVLGRAFVMHTFQVTVVGVLPRGFRYLSSRAQIFRPFAHYRHRRTHPAFFVWEGEVRLGYDSVNRWFLLVACQIGLRKPGDRRGPRIHDLRHPHTIANPQARRSDPDSVNAP